MGAISLPGRRSALVVGVRCDVNMDKIGHATARGVRLKLTARPSVAYAPGALSLSVAMLLGSGRRKSRDASGAYKRHGPCGRHVSVDSHLPGPRHLSHCTSKVVRLRELSVCLCFARLLTKNLNYIQQHVLQTYSIPCRSVCSMWHL